MSFARGLSRLDRLQHLDRDGVGQVGRNFEISLQSTRGSDDVSRRQACRHIDPAPLKGLELRKRISQPGGTAPTRSRTDLFLRIENNRLLGMMYHM